MHQPLAVSLPSQSGLKLSVAIISQLQQPLAASLPSSPGLHHGPSRRLKMEDWMTQTTWLRTMKYNLHPLNLSLATAK